MLITSLSRIPSRVFDCAETVSRHDRNTVSDSVRSRSGDTSLSRTTRAAILLSEVRLKREMSTGALSDNARPSRRDSKDVAPCDVASSVGAGGLLEVDLSERDRDAIDVVEDAAVPDRWPPRAERGRRRLG